ncbi:unnamed protein product [Vicia faba]|uniref:Aminotransferase-like plant mobile domain-containing protein n=1 Tax=Vicia faba TaxID=3906 RepID=A0AAV0ZFG3_VICFA|nr:unnamed protein product [Vicia faba]
MNHQKPLQDNIMETRECFMLSPAAHCEPTLRTAHFLKPTANSIHELNFHPSSSSSLFDPKECSFKINFNGWRYPRTKWVRWLDQLKPMYESLWKNAGIFGPIMSTKSHIMKNQDLVYGVVEKWCSETNTFVFPFGEATITLEDVVVLGGYSLFGDPVFTPLEDQDMKEVEKKLMLARQERSKKGMTSTSVWMDAFIDKSSEIEHEAFLVTWLSIFVFPHKYNVVKSCLFPIAVLLARGNPIALAPSVLASLYKDLTLFKETIVGFKKCWVGGDRFPMVWEVSLQSPFYLVQVWVWERFQNLQPQPKLINKGDHVLLRWNMVKALQIENVRLALESAIDDFMWRPYFRYADNCGMFYPNDEISVPFKKHLDKQMLSFVLCLRVSELVGIECIEQYLPHRVAMQFGMDQDVPGYVSRFNETKELAWKNYTRPLSDTSLYFPSKFFEADVTTRYTKWWAKSVLGPQGSVKNVVPRERNVKSSKCSPEAKLSLEFSLKLVGPVTLGKSCDDGSKTSRSVNIVDDDHVPSDFIPKLLTTMSSENSVEDGLKAEKNVVADARSSLPQKHNTPSPFISVEDCMPVLEEDVEFIDANEIKEARMSSDRISESGTREESYSYLTEASIAELEQRISRLEKVHANLKSTR